MTEEDDPDNVINQYRKHADECLLFSETAHTPEHKAILVEMARLWRDMAKRAAVRGGRDQEGGC